MRSMKTNRRIGQVWVAGILISIIAGCSSPSEKVADADGVEAAEQEASVPKK